MVPTELLVTSMVGGFSIAVTAVVAMAGVLGSRISDVREELRDFRGDVNGRFAAIDDHMTLIRDELVTVRASLGAIDARLTTLEQR